MKLLSARQIAARNTKVMPLHAEIQALIGTVPYDFKMFVYGYPAAGKTTFATMLAGHLAKCSKVLYLSGEEKAGTTVRMRLQRLGLNEAQLYYPEAVPSFEQIREALPKFKIVIIDSVQSLHLTFGQCQEILEIMSDKSLILISQVNNRGKNPLLKLEHLTDIKILLRKGGVAEIGSRYKQKSESVNWFNIKIFKQ